MKKQILLASLLLCSAVAFSSEEQAKNTSEAQVLAVLVKQNELLTEQLKEANKPAYGKNISIFIFGAVAAGGATSLVAYAIWKDFLNEMSPNRSNYRY
ncbi:MAG: hypothetical protein NTZ68_00070 [Candidatus Dependentiae bacterium]|nr:hypothetical protein [Candidatus Dependentiae bacterium]